jgi:hypothetical protein
MTPLPEPTDDELEHQLRGSRALQSAPEPVIQRAFAIWQPRAAAAPSLLHRLVAALSFDSGWAAAPALGVRSTGGRQRQLLFTVQGHDVDLRIAPRPAGRFLISGQVLGPTPSGELALAIGSHAQHAVLDELGEFRFEPAPAGECRIVLQLQGLQGLQATLPPFTLPGD